MFANWELIQNAKMSLPSSNDWVKLFQHRAQERQSLQPAGSLPHLPHLQADARDVIAGKILPSDPSTEASEDLALPNASEALAPPTTVSIVNPDAHILSPLLVKLRLSKPRRCRWTFSRDPRPTGLLCSGAAPMAPSIARRRSQSSDAHRRAYYHPQRLPDSRRPEFALSTPASPPTRLVRIR